MTNDYAPEPDEPSTPPGCALAIVGGTLTVLAFSKGEWLFAILGVALTVAGLIWQQRSS